ncbi:MAG: hypothetical protein LC802_17955 [Acidobacteria bacterium]|nr:hypothetical protein [Acidobacteriota bacterium]
MPPSLSPRTAFAAPKSSDFASEFRPAAALLLGLVFAAACAMNARAQVRLPPSETTQQQQQQQQQARTPPPPIESDESESEDERAESVRPRVTDPAASMRAARVILVRSNTAFVNEREVEDSLRKRKEFRAWGLALTRSDADADLVIEIERKPFSRRFAFSVLDPRTMLVVTSGKTRSVLFGKKIPNKIAEKFMNRLKTVRPLPGS